MDTNAAASTVTTASGVISTGSTYQLAWVVDWSTNVETFYLNVVSRGSTTLTLTGSVNPTGRWEIGAHPTSYHTGNLSDVRIHNRALSTEEIAQMCLAHR